MLIVHSYLYYHLDKPLISDEQWQTLANELVKKQKKYKKKINCYDKEFSDWTGATGMHLPVNKWVENTAERLLQYRFKHE